MSFDDLSDRQLFRLSMLLMDDVKESRFKLETENQELPVEEKLQILYKMLEGVPNFDLSSIRLGEFLIELLEKHQRDESPGVLIYIFRMLIWTISETRQSLSDKGLIPLIVRLTSRFKILDEYSDIILGPTFHPLVVSCFKWPFGTHRRHSMVRFPKNTDNLLEVYSPDTEGAEQYDIRKLDGEIVANLGRIDTGTHRPQALILPPRLEVGEIRVTGRTDGCEIWRKGVKIHMIPLESATYYEMNTFDLSHDGTRLVTSTAKYVKIWQSWKWNPRAWFWLVYCLVSCKTDKKCASIITRKILNFLG